MHSFPAWSDNPAAWLGLSFLVAVIATHVALLAARWMNHRADAPFTAGMWLAQSLFYLFPPILAWRAGAVSAAHLGIARVEWLRTLNYGAPLALGVVAILLLGWQAYWRRARTAETTPAAPPLQGLAGLIDAVLLQWHWAFYRAAAIATLLLLAPSTEIRGPTPMLLAALRGDPVYWGAWLGLIVAGAEWLLNPWAQRTLRTPRRREAALRSAALAVATTGLYLITGNLWSGVVCHVAVELAATLRLPAQLGARGK